LKLINKLWFGALNLFSYLTYLRESECKFSIFFLYLNYSLVYPVFSAVIHFLSIGFCFRLVWFTFYRVCFSFLFAVTLHSLQTLYFFSRGLCDYLIRILLKKIHLILVSNLFWRVYFILCSCMLKIVYSLSFILF